MHILALLEISTVYFMQLAPVRRIPFQDPLHLWDPYFSAFASASVIVLPAIERKRAPTYVNVVVGTSICIKFIMKL
jgi:hypothetical protein